MGRLQEEERAKGYAQYYYFPSDHDLPNRKLNVKHPSVPIQKVFMASKDVNQRPWCQVLQIFKK